MKRRTFITLLGGAAAAWPLAARAQEDGRTYRLGFLLPSARQTPAVEAFFDELRLNGFVEGKNLVVVPGFEATDNNLAERAAALVNAAPDAIVAGPAPPLRALQAITSHSSACPKTWSVRDWRHRSRAPAATSPASVCSPPN